MAVTDPTTAKQRRIAELKAKLKHAEDGRQAHESHEVQGVWVDGRFYLVLTPREAGRD